ncbi:MAG TPA: hypothetical protein VGO65_04820 [Pseudolysinimonas sp.]|jgi:hypothetical protein|nr:hypothetical protein [Pseudolysinimonas sp.]
MKTKILIFAALLIASVSAAAPAQAVRPIQFGSWDYSTFDEVYAQILAEYGSSVTAWFFADPARGGDARTIVPELGQLSPATQSKALLAASESARSGSPLPARYGAIGGPATEPQSVVLSVPAVPVMGSAIANKRAWQRVTTFYWTVCNPTCHNDSSLQFRYTTNPGNLGTSTSLNFLETGNQIGNLTLRSDIYANGTLFDSVTTPWASPGSGVQRNFHAATAGKAFVALYITKIGTPNGVATDTYKTGTATCSQGTSPICQWP